MTTVLINGTHEETISINDRGLLYGDGLFETMAVTNNKIGLWEDHWQRLSLGCEKLSINLPDKALISKDIEQLCQGRNDERFVIKLIVTRGISARGYRFNDTQPATRILSSHPWPEYKQDSYRSGVKVCYCETRLSENSQLAGIKHLNRLEQVLARNEWNDEFQEGLMLTAQGHVVDGTMSNIFAVQNNILFTPELSRCGVSGVMREQIIKIAKELGFSVYEKIFTKYELEDADELFLTNSLFGIWPVKSIAKTRFTKVGAVTRQLQNEFKNRFI